MQHVLHLWMLASLLVGLLVSYCIDFSYLVIHSPSHPMFIAAVISIAVDGFRYLVECEVCKF
jgi:hypothetical protein